MLSLRDLRSFKQWTNATFTFLFASAGMSWVVYQDVDGEERNSRRKENKQRERKGRKKGEEGKTRLDSEYK